VKLDCTTADASIAAGDLCVIQQNIEGYNLKRFVGQTATFSFWVKAGKTGTMCVAFRNSGNDRSYVAETTIDAPNTWERKTVTLTFDYSGGTWDFTNGTGIRVSLVLAMGSTYHTTKDAWQTGEYMSTSSQTNFVDSTGSTCDVWFTGVQFELGEQATDFEFLPQDVTLAACQRYYEILYPCGKTSYNSSSGQAIAYSHAYNVEKRTASPTVTRVGGFGTNANCINPYLSLAGAQCARLQSESSGGGFPLRTYWLDHKFTVDAEL
jgi:hypothetical protein